MKKTILLILTLITLVQASAAEEEISVAAFMPLSGPWSPNGDYTQEGIKLAQESLKKDGITLNVRFEDACFAKDVVKSLKSLTVNSSIEGIVANYCVLGLAAMESMVKRDKLITFHNSIVPGKYIDNKDAIYTTFPTTDEEAFVIAQYAYTKLGARKAAILQLISQWGEGFGDSFTKHFEAMGGKVVTREENSTPVSDFRSELSRIKHKDIDLIFLAHAGADITLALKQIDALGIKVPLITTSEAYDDNITKAGGSSANGLVFFIPELNKENKFVKRMFEEHPELKTETLRPLTSHAYVSSMAYAEGRSKCGKDDSCFTDFLSSQVLDLRGGGSWDESKFTSIKVKEGKFKKISS